MNNPWLPAAENPRVKAVNCSVCKGTCWDRDWAKTPGQAGGGPGTKCTSMPNRTLSKLISPCHLGCSCVPPANSYDYRTHSNVSCCKIAEDIKLPDGTPANCDGKKLPTADKDRGKDYNHSTFLDLIIEGLCGIRAALSNLLVIHPLADDTIKYFALDNVNYHGRNVSVLWDPQGSQWPAAACKVRPFFKGPSQRRVWGSIRCLLTTTRVGAGLLRVPGWEGRGEVADSEAPRNHSVLSRGAAAGGVMQ